MIVALRMRMAYLRKPDNLKRGNPSNKSGTSAPAKKVMPAAPIVSLSPIGEDEASLQRHKKKLKDEMKRVSPNKQIVRELMKRTYELRRKEIMECTGTIHDILLSYPALKDSGEVSYPLFKLPCYLNYPCNTE